MAKASRAWFRKSKNAWYCTVEGRKVSLGVKGEENEKEAVKAWHRIMAGLESPTLTPEPIQTPQVAPMVKANGVSVQSVITAFLEDAQDRMKPNTWRTYRLFLLPFADAHDGRACDLTPCLCEAYARRKTEWSDSTRNGFLGALATAFRWAVKARIINQTPLAGMTRPPKRSRGADALLTADEYAHLLAHATPQFGVMVKVLWLTGCRPSEAAAITAENFDADNGMVRLEDHKMAHKGKNRVLFLCPEAVALLKAQKQQGHLLRNSFGRRWTAQAIQQAMEATRKRAGLPKAIAYGLRHSFATDALANGVPDAQVAELLGHSGTAMLHKHYSHLGARAKTLREALGRVR